MSAAIMEINIPAGASEVTLKTAGQYCDKDICVTTSHSFKILKGSFTPEADTNVLSLAIPAGVKAIEIIPQETPANPDGKCAICCAHGVQFVGDNAKYAADKAFSVDYWDPATSKYVRVAYIWDTTSGLSVTMDTVLVFRAGITYNYTAYYWDE